MDISGAFDQIAMTTSQSIKAEEGDYIVDGLLYCHKCHTPKQCRIEISGEIRTPMCLCKCEKEKRDQREAEIKMQEFQRHIAKLKRMGFPDSEMEKWTFDRDDHQNEKISTVARNYAQNFDQLKEKGKGLLGEG